MRLLLLISIKKLTMTVTEPFGFIPPNIKYQKICLPSQIIMLRIELPSFPNCYTLTRFRKKERDYFEQSLNDRGCHKPRSPTEIFDMGLVVRA